MSKQTKMFGEEERELKVVKGMSLKDATDIASTLLTLNDGWCEKIEVVGSIRRKKATVNDVDFVVITTDKNWRILRENMEKGFDAVKVISGDKIHRFIVPFDAVGNVQVDFYRSELNTWGVYMLVRTGSAEHNIWLAKYALKNKMRLKYSVGLVDNAGNLIAGDEERKIFCALGLDWVPPPQREMKGGKPVWRK